MMKKLMSLGLVGIISASLMVGCNSNNNDKDDTVTIKYVDDQGNVKREKVTKDEAKQIERKQQTTDTTKKEQTTKEQPKDEDDMTDDEMQEKGYLKKMASEADGRVTYIAVTRKGTNLSQKYDEQYFKSLLPYMEEISDEDAECMIRTIEKFYQIMCERRKHYDER